MWKENFLFGVDWMNCECEYDGEEQMYQCEECYHAEERAKCICKDDENNVNCQECYWMSYADIDISCDVCQCNVFKGEETFRVFANDRWYEMCVLCSKAAEALGWRLV